MPSMLNKIWSNDSLLNDYYTKGLTEQAIKDSKSISYNAELGNRKVKQLSNKQPIGLCFEKVGLSLGLLVPGLRGRIIKAFTTVQNLKEGTVVKTLIEHEKIKKRVVQAPIEASREPASKLTSKEQMLQDIKNFIHPDIETVWKGVFDKFDPEIVKSWSSDAEGNFKLELNKPMRVWVPSKDDKGSQEPSSGMVLLLGTNGNGASTGTITGKLDRENKDMKFSKGFHFFMKPDNARAKPGYSNITNLQYVNGNIRIITNKDLKKDYSGLILSIVASVAGKYGTVDNNYILTVTKQRSLANIIANWNSKSEVIENEKQRLGVK